MEEQIAISREILENSCRKESARLDSAVAYINGKVNEANRSLMDIGKFLLRELYDDCLEKAESRERRDGFSLRKIASHEHITLSYRSLSNAVRLAVQERRYFAHNGTFSRLSESHKVMLLCVDDSSDKIQMAKDVLSKNLSVRHLKSRLVDMGYAKRQGPKAGISSGSPATELRKIVAVFEDLDPVRVSSNAPLSEEDRVALLESFKAAHGKLQRLITLLSQS